MRHSEEFTKSFANDLARQMRSGQGLQMFRRMRIAGLLDGSTNCARPATERQSVNGSAEIERVGIWERKKNAMHFSRCVEMIQDWPHWASVGRIGPKQPGKRRIVIIGESVARGYLFDPQFTPAMVLEKILQSQMGRSAVEVIDLARTNLGFEVKELAIAALLLDPDLVVIFSGNNWGYAYSRREDFAETEAMLGLQGIVGIKNLIETRLAQRVQDTVKCVAFAFQPKKIPLLWIVPEFNLGDWRDPVANAPHLPNGGNQEWISLWRSSSAALDAGELDAAAKMGDRMIELDGGVCAAGFYVLAECSRAKRAFDAARTHLEHARDSIIWDHSALISPRCFGITRRTLLSEASHHGNEVVDLAGIFREYLKGGIPDRRLFIDYCHLTVEGIQVAMSASAACILRVLAREDRSWRSLWDKNIAPPATVKAEASFLAAVHNAHWNQSSELVRYYCEQALELAPAIAPVMCYFADFQSRRAPMLMCKTAGGFLESEWLSIQHHFIRNRKDQQLDLLLLDAVMSALKAKVGMDISERLTRLRVEEYSVKERSANLLDYYYCSSARQPREQLWVTPGRQSAKHSQYYKARWPESRFFFVAEALSPVRLSIACRLPHCGPAGANVRVELNGKAQGQFAAGLLWDTLDITLPGEAVRDGVNEVTIHWPVPQFPGKQGLKDIVEDTLGLRTPEFYCVFGEIHSFTATCAGQARLNVTLHSVEQSQLVSPAG